MQGKKIMRTHVRTQIDYIELSLWTRNRTDGGWASAVISFVEKV